MIPPRILVQPDTAVNRRRRAAASEPKRVRVWNKDRGAFLECGGKWQKLHRSADGTRLSKKCEESPPRLASLAKAPWGTFPLTFSTPSRRPRSPYRSPRRQRARVSRSAVSVRVSRSAGQPVSRLIHDLRTYGLGAAASSYMNSTKENTTPSRPWILGFLESIRKYSSGACAPEPWPSPKLPAGSLSGSPVNT